ncbi:MAG: alcohol dehydrogenase catalytic domain-containing protein, partial [Gemmataceae bacterium]|nr:alcohol dehydrogenase catalytic domain-containing protein [Gemmataceae bacterium]
MTALRVHAFGGPVQAEEVDTPRPGDGEALVRMTASVVSHHDLGVVAGTLPHAPPPFTPGLEGAGIVAGLGEGADGPALGTAVRLVMRGQADGTWSEYVVVPARALVPVPEGLAPDVAAACGTVSASAW